MLVTARLHRLKADRNLYLWEANMGLLDKFFNKTNASNLIFITNTEFKQLLDKELSPKMLERGFKYNGQYTWYGEMHNHMRKSISLYLLKGMQGVFQWSVTFDFIPYLSGNRLLYSRTEKKIYPHISVFAKDYCNSFRTDEGMKAWINSPCKTTMMGKSIQEIEKRIHTAFSYNLKEFEDWHSKFETLNNALCMASEIKDIQYIPSSPTLFKVSPFIKAFLLAATGDKHDGKALLEHCFSNNRWMYSEYNDDIKNKIRQKIDSLELLTS